MKPTYAPSPRAEVVTRRTYNRPLDKEGGVFETWEQTIDRVIGHQRWLWERARDEHLGPEQEAELEELRGLMLRRESLLSGRTLWLGGTEVAKRREQSQFNCAFLKIATVHDVVDAYWSLLQGVGVGFEPLRGSLSGFTAAKEVAVVRSEMTREEWDSGIRGQEENYEYFAGDTWTIQVGDSAEAWAKAVGKLLAGKNNSKRLVLDFSQIRPAGIRLSGYMWISSGDEAFCKALAAIAELLNARVDQMLSRMDVHDIITRLGATLSSRRSALVSMVPFGDIEWEEFALCKKDSWKNGNEHRSQSNNTIEFFQRPSKLELRAIFDIIREGMGSEPGMLNAEAAQRRAPFWAGNNPCVEIQLPNRGLCNLCTTDLSKFNGRFDELLRAMYIIGRANYRQTCVNLEDEILQRSWHENNEFLRLTGVSISGIVQWEYHTSAERLRALRDNAQTAVQGMADELQLPRSKGITTVKPEGCMPAGSLVTTDAGIFTMEELHRDHEPGTVWSDYLGEVCVQQKDGMQPVVRTFDNGMAELLRIKLSLGMELLCTPEHMWHVVGQRSRPGASWVSAVDRWVPAEQLTACDTIEVCPGTYLNSASASLVSINAEDFDGNSHQIHQPKVMNPDLAWLLGYLWGDGSLWRSGRAWHASFVDQRSDNLAKCVSILASQFGLKGHLRVVPGKNAQEVRVGSVQLAEWLRVNGAWKYADNGELGIMPLCVRASSTEDIMAFLAGLFDADGYVATRGKYRVPRISQTAEAFTTNLQQVAIAVGLVFSRSAQVQRKNSYGEGKPIYDMILSPQSHPDAALMFHKHSIKMNTHAGVEPWAWEGTGMGRTLGRVVDVEEAGVAHTYDAEVGGDHTYFSGAVRTHNTASKIMNCSEGAHKPLGRFIINKIKFGVHDPLLPILREANYRTMPDPYDNTGVLVDFPVDFSGIEFEKVTLDDGRVVEVNTESAVTQLERYKLLMDNYVSEHNVSNTISYSPDEVPAMIEWIYENWDHYVGVSFLYRNDPTKTAEDLGYPYLPQQVVTEDEHAEYAAQLKPFDLNAGKTL